MDVMNIAEDVGLVYHCINGDYISPYIEDTNIGEYVKEFAQKLVEEIANCIEHGNPELCISDKDMAKSYERNSPTRKYYANIVREIKIVD